MARLVFAAKAAKPPATYSQAVKGGGSLDKIVSDARVHADDRTSVGAMAWIDYRTSQARTHGRAPDMRGPIVRARAHVPRRASRRPRSRRISPASAADASRAVVLTASPSAVKSLTPRSPTEPTKAIPVWTASPGDPCPTMPGLGEELTRGVDRRRGVVEPAHPRDEQAHDLVPDELVDDRLAVHEDAGGDLIEAVEQVREVARRHPLGHAGRAAHVSEQHRSRDRSGGSLRHSPHHRSTAVDRRDSWSPPPGTRAAGPDRTSRASRPRASA